MVTYAIETNRPTDNSFVMHEEFRLRPWLLMRLKPTNCQSTDLLISPKGTVTYAIETNWLINYAWRIPPEAMVTYAIETYTGRAGTVFASKVQSTNLQIYPVFVAGFQRD